MTSALPALVIAAAGWLAFPQDLAAQALPAACAEQSAPGGVAMPLSELRMRAEAEILTDPVATVAILCSGLARASVELGAGSADTAWWALSLAMPLIAFLDRHAEAEPLLDFALPVFERELGPHAAEVAEVHVAWAWIHFRRGQLSDCEAAWLRALAIREQNPGERSIELQKVLVGLAQVRLSRGDFSGTQQALDRAAAILVLNGESVSEAAAAVENVYTNLALRREDFAAARRHAEHQLSIERQLERSAAQLTTPMALLGQILERLNEFEESEQVLREAARIADSVDGPPQRHQLVVLVQLARLLDQRGRPTDALPVALRAVATAEQTLGPTAPRLVAALTILGDVHRALGDLPASLTAYERAAGIVDAASADVDRPSLVAFHRGLALLDLELGDLPAAGQQVRSGLQATTDESTLIVERALLLQVRARTTAAEDQVSAYEDLAEALRLLRSRLPESHPRILRVLNELCGLEVDTADVSAPHCAAAAIRLDTPDHADPALQSLVLVNQSRLAALRGDYELSYGHAIRALASVAGSSPDAAWRAELQLARSLRQRHLSRLAVLVGKRSLETIESLRRRFADGDEQHERGFVAGKAEAYRTVADWLLEDDRIEEGLQVLSLLKTEEFMAFMARGGTASAAVSLSYTPEEQRIAAQLDTALAAEPVDREVARLGRLEETGRLSVIEKRQLDTLRDRQLVAAGPRAGRLRAVLAPQVPQQGRPAAGQPPASLQQGLARLGPDTALVVYLLAGNRLHTIVATRTGVTESQISVDATVLRQDIGRLLDGIGRRADVTAISRRLYQVLIAPFESQARAAGATRLAIWADGALRYVPFAALHDGRDFLIASYAIHLYAEPPTNPVTPDAQHEGGYQIRGFGLTRAMAGYPPLPGVADELCGIVSGPINGLTATTAGCSQPGIGSGALPGEGFADLAFSEQQLRSVLAPPRLFSVMHLGTHFRLRPGNALRSYLLMGDGNQMTLDRVAGLDFGGIDLVTLSACQTGLGGSVTDDGREIESFSLLLQRRGATRVIASLWQVEDASTGQLMRSLYRGLSAGSSAADALRAAQQQLRSLPGHAHPYYWAGFVVSGWRL